MSNRQVILDWTNATIIVLTFIFFAAALFMKGLVHDILLEVGVFLVSVKLILATFKITQIADRIEEKIDTLIDKGEK